MMWQSNAISRWLVIAALIAVLPAGPLQASEKAVTPAAPALTSIKFSFLVDRRITRGMYMGDHWISPLHYVRVGEEKIVIVPVRAFGLDADKRETKIEPQWKSSDPGKLQVSPVQGHQVEITVLKPGKSYLTVTHGKISKKLVVEGETLSGTLRVEISQ
jgi:hypothetical protein